MLMLEEVMTMDRNSLAQTLVRFYIAYKAVIPFLECLIIKEVENTGEWACLGGRILVCIWVRVSKQ